MSSQSENDSEDPTDSVEDLATQLGNFVIKTIISQGEWQSSHPWEGIKPNPKELKMKASVTNSRAYPISCRWTKENGDVDLAKILLNLPSFVESEMQGSINGSRQELEQLVIDIFRGIAEESLKGKLSPHVGEIVDEIRKNTSQHDKPIYYPDSSFQATSIDEVHFVFGLYQSEEFYIDCENMVKMYVPKSLISWFDIEECETIQWIRKISYPHKEKRWIFTPSFRRPKIALLNWPKDEIVTEESTIRILVVRPSEFEEYMKYCVNLFPVICLPQDVTGAGYPRYWIQKIAQHLKLNFIWMIDDSVECFYEYSTNGKHTIYELLKFGLVLERIENFVKEADDSEYPIAAMSPRRLNWRYRVTKPFVCKPAQCAVYLNLRALSEKNEHYRPELKTFEDMIFAYECEKKGLKVYMDNRVHLQDHEWKNTGARSPSVKGTSKT